MKGQKWGKSFSFELSWSGVEWIHFPYCTWVGFSCFAFGLKIMALVTLVSSDPTSYGTTLTLSNYYWVVDQLVYIEINFSVFNGFRIFFSMSCMFESALVHFNKTSLVDLNLSPTTIILLLLGFNLKSLKSTPKLAWIKWCLSQWATSCVIDFHIIE